jgi:hypothetical protein
MEGQIIESFSDCVGLGSLLLSTKTITGVQIFFWLAIARRSLDVQGVHCGIGW